MTRRKYLSFYFLLLCLSVLLSLFLLEFAFRIFFPQPLGPAAFGFDAQMGPIPVPNQKSERFLPGDGYYTTTNDALGMRICSSASGEAASGTTGGILFLGDSFTYGSGVSDCETFAAHVDQELRRSGLTTLVRNAGNPGVGTDYALKFLVQRGALLSPDLIVLGFFANDFADNSGNRYYNPTAKGELRAVDLSESFKFFRDKEKLLNSSTYEWLSSHSHLLGFLRRYLAWRSLAKDAAGFDKILRALPDDGPLREGMVSDYRLPFTRTYLKKMKQASTQLGAKFLPLYLPSRVDLERRQAGRGEGPDEKAFIGLCRELGLPCLSLTPGITSVDYASLYLRDGHFSHAGHEQVAQVILPIIKKYLATHGRSAQQSLTGAE